MVRVLRRRRAARQPARESGATRRRSRLPQFSPRRVRSDKGSVRVTRRDLILLRWIGDQRVVCLDHLQELLGRMPGGTTQVPGRLSVKRVRAIVRRWEVAGLVHTRKILFSYPAWVWLTPAGCQHIGLPYWGGEPRVGTLMHHYGVNAARLLCERSFPQAAWKSERSLLSEVSKQRMARQRIAHLPDAELLCPGAVRAWAVEVELTPKPLRELVKIVFMLGDRYERVYYFVPPALEGLLASALETPGVARERFLVCSLPWPVWEES